MWWKKKRWWFLLIFALYLGSQFVPYSTSGPALSCFTSTIYSNAAPFVRLYSKGVDGDFPKIDSYLRNSDFRIRNFLIGGKYSDEKEFPEDSVTFVYLKNESNFHCFIMDVISFEPTIVSVTAYDQKNEPFNRIYDIN